jgi:hypothetical protein
MAVSISNVIHKLLAQADYYDLLGETYDGQLMREAAAALAEAHNQKAITGMFIDILKGGK